MIFTNLQNQKYFTTLLQERQAVLILKIKI